MLRRLTGQFADVRKLEKADEESLRRNARTSATTIAIKSKIYEIFIVRKKERKMKIIYQIISA